MISPIRKALALIVATLGLIFFACDKGFVPTPAAPSADVQTVGLPTTVCVSLRQCWVSGTIVNRGPDCASRVTVAATATEATSSFPVLVSTDSQEVGSMAVGASARIDVCCLSGVYPRVILATGVTPAKCR
jgi:hypothetical protein